MARRQPRLMKKKPEDRAEGVDALQLVKRIITEGKARQYTNFRGLASASAFLGRASVWTEEQVAIVIRVDHEWLELKVADWEGIGPLDSFRTNNPAFTIWFEREAQILTVVGKKGPLPYRAKFRDILPSPSVPDAEPGT